jgi:hypothetical protein
MRTNGSVLKLVHQVLIADLPKPFDIRSVERQIKKDLQYSSRKSDLKHEPEWFDIINTEQQH